MAMACDEVFVTSDDGDSVCESDKKWVLLGAREALTLTTAETAHMPQSGAKALLARLLSVVGPVALLGAAIYGVWSFQDKEEQIATQNAGNILNARVVDGGAVVAMDRMLARRTAKVLVIGASLANTDIKPKLLASRLGYQPDDAVVFSVPASVAPHWYAILKYRLYAAGHEPEVVVVVSTLQGMVLNTPVTEASHVNLTVQLPDEGDPVIQEKVKRTSSQYVTRLREGRTKVRTKVFEAARTLPAALFFTSERTGGRMGRGEAAGVMSEVFADDKTDMALLGNATPIVELNRERRFLDTQNFVSAQDSFIPEITDMVSEHGGRILWVRPPLSPDTPEEFLDVVPEGTAEQAGALIQARGGHFLDLSDLDYPASLFQDWEHMTDNGATQFTGALVTEMKDRDITERPVVTETERPGAHLWSGEGTNPTTFATPPQPVPNLELESRKGGVGGFSTSGMPILSSISAVVRPLTSTRCSPVRVLEDGVPLSRPNAMCREVAGKKFGRSCHATEGILFSASDGSDPATNGRVYTAGLSEDRTCGSAMWLYPNDTLSAQFPAEQMATQTDAFRSFVLTGRNLQARPLKLNVRLVVNGEERVNTTFDGRGLSKGPVTWRLDPPVPNDAEVTLHIGHREPAFYLFEDARLSPDDPMADDRVLDNGSVGTP